MGESDRVILATVDRWLDLISSMPSSEEAAPWLAAGASFVEHPNLFQPTGSVRDRAGMLAGIDAGRAILARQSFSDRIHDVLDDRRVLSRATWRGVLSTAVGPYAAGTTLRADIAMLIETVDEQIVRQENWDCYHPIE